jgi:hypothetical protein
MSNSNSERGWVEDAIRNEVLGTLSERAERWIEVRGLPMIPDGRPFAAPSVECRALFRDGYYLGCIALTQTVAEAIVRYVWQIKHGKKPIKSPEFEKSLEDLSSRGFITADTKDKIERIWDGRNNYHHLNPSVETDCGKLETVAREKLLLLGDVEKVFFDFSVSNGYLVPKNTEFWPSDAERTRVYLRAYP